MPTVAAIRGPIIFRPQPDRAVPVSSNDENPPYLTSDEHLAEWARVQELSSRRGYVRPHETRPRIFRLFRHTTWKREYNSDGVAVSLATMFVSAIVLTTASGVGINALWAVIGIMGGTGASLFISHKAHAKTHAVTKVCLHVTGFLLLFEVIEFINAIVANIGAPNNG